MDIARSKNTLCKLCQMMLGIDFWFGWWC